MKKEYIDQVLKQIKNKSYKELIAQELDSHIADKTYYYIDIGYSKEDAEQKAVEEMGSPDEAAVALGSLHNIKWYKKSELWLGILLVALQTYLMIFFPNNFKYSDSNYVIFHFISIDFLSLLIFAANIYLIYLIRKQHNVPLLVPIVASLIMGFFSNTFEPMLYAAAIIFTKGFGGYIDSIFSYSYTIYTFDKICSAIHILSIAITVVLLVLSLCTAYTVYSEQICRDMRKAKKLLCIAEKVLICFLAVNIAVMSTGTVIALVTLDDKLEENYSVRKEMIDYYINFDNVGKTAENIIAEFDEAGYRYTDISSKYDSNSYNGSNYICYKDNAAFLLYDVDFSYNIYAVTTIGVKAVLNRNLFIDENEFDRFKRNMKDCGESKPNESLGIYSQYSYKNESAPIVYDESKSMTEQSKLPPEKRPYTLEEFLNEKIYANAFLVDSSRSNTDKNATSYEFSFKLKNSKYKEVQLEFFGGMLTYMEFTEY